MGIMVAAARCGLVRVVLRLWVLAATEAIGRWLATAGVTGRGPPRAVGDGAGRRANAARRGGPRVRGGVGAGLQGGPSARGGGAPRCCGCVAGAPPPPSAGGAPQKPVSPTHARWGLASWRARAAETETACARWILCRAMWLAGGPAAAHRRRPAGCVEFFAQGRRTSHAMRARAAQRLGLAARAARRRGPPRTQDISGTSRLCSTRASAPARTAAALARHSAPAASNENRTERIRPAAVSSQRISTRHDSGSHARAVRSASRPLAGPCGLLGASWWRPRGAAWAASSSGSGSSLRRKP